MFSLTPIVRRILILWVVIWVLEFLSSLGGFSLSALLHLDPNEILSGDFIRIPSVLSYTIAHQNRNLWHLLGNAWMFALFAPEVERLFPGRRFLLFLLRAALAGAAITILLAWCLPQSFSSPVLGGSGLVAAVFAASAAMYPDRVLSLIVIRVRLLTLFLILTGLDILGFLAQLAGQGEPVAYVVHLSGALIGWMAVGGFQRFSTPWSRISAKLGQRKQEQGQKDVVADEEKLDQILAKISRDGMNSLTDSERRFLVKRSRGRD